MDLWCFGGGGFLGCGFVVLVTAVVVVVGVALGLGLGYGGGRVGLGCFGGGSGWSVVAGVADVGVLMLVNLEC